MYFKKTDKLSLAKVRAAFNRSITQRIQTTVYETRKTSDDDEDDYSVDVDYETTDIVVGGDSIQAWEVFKALRPEKYERAWGKFLDGYVFHKRGYYLKDRQVHPEEVSHGNRKDYVRVQPYGIPCRQDDPARNKVAHKWKLGSGFVVVFEDWYLAHKNGRKLIGLGYPHLTGEGESHVEFTCTRSRNPNALEELPLHDVAYCVGEIRVSREVIDVSTCHDAYNKYIPGPLTATITFHKGGEKSSGKGVAHAHRAA